MERSNIPLVTIETANLRDLSFVAANMRDEDWREIACQYPPNLTRLDIAYAAFASPEAWVATVRGQPVAAFGVSRITVSVLSAWAFATRSMWRAVPAVTRFIRDECARRWAEAGITRVEARSIAGHHVAHRWMASMGGTCEPCPAWGRDGEDFMLWWWTR